MGIRATLARLSQLLRAHDGELWEHLEKGVKINPQFYAFRCAGGWVGGWRSGGRQDTALPAGEGQWSASSVATQSAALSAFTPCYPLAKPG